jgi:hypothetical protein
VMTMTSSNEGAVHLERVAARSRGVDVEGVLRAAIDHAFIEGRAHPASG